MPNPNYIAGRAFEYKRMAHWRDKGHVVLRMAGSHGPFDLVAIRPGDNVTLIQCKRVETQAQARRLATDWRTKPRIIPGRYHQCLEVYVRDTGKVEDWTV